MDIEMTPNGKAKVEAFLAGRASKPAIVEISGYDLDSLLKALGVPKNRRADIRTLRVCIDGGLKVKSNEGMWSPPLGEIQEV